MLKSQLDLVFLLIAAIIGYIVVLTWYVCRQRKILNCMKSNLNLKEIDATPELVDYTREQRDKHHWSHPKYKAYNDRLRELGAL